MFGWLISSKTVWPGPRRRAFWAYARLMAIEVHCLEQACHLIGLCFDKSQNPGCQENYKQHQFSHLCLCLISPSPLPSPNLSLPSYLHAWQQMAAWQQVYNRIRPSTISHHGKAQSQDLGTPQPWHLPGTILWDLKRNQPSPAGGADNTAVKGTVDRVQCTVSQYRPQAKMQAWWADVLWRTLLLGPRLAYWGPCHLSGSLRRCQAVMLTAPTVYIIN